MKTMDDLTPEIEAKIPEYLHRITSGLGNGEEYANWKPETTTAYIQRMYAIAGYEAPRVVIASTPTEYKKLYSQLFGTVKSDSLINAILSRDVDDVEGISAITADAITADIAKENLTSDSSWLWWASGYARVWLNWYWFLHIEFDLPLEESVRDNLKFLYDNCVEASCARGYFTEPIALLLRMPQYTHLGDNGLHNVNGPSWSYPDGSSGYHVNGRVVPSWVIEDEVTFEQFNAEENEDVRAGIVTVIKERKGDKGLLEFLGAELVDDQTIEHANGYSEVMRLYKTKESYEIFTDSQGNSNVPAAFIEMTCPSTGQVYLIDTCPTFTDAKECAKWMRPEGVPQTVPYFWQSAN